MIRGSPDIATFVCTIMPGAATVPLCWLYPALNFKGRFFSPCVKTRRNLFPQPTWRVERSHMTSGAPGRKVVKLLLITTSKGA